MSLNYLFVLYYLTVLVYNKTTIHFGVSGSQICTSSHLHFDKKLSIEIGHDKEARVSWEQSQIVRLNFLMYCQIYCFFKTTPKVSFTNDETEKLTDRIQNAGTEVVNAKAGSVSG